MTSDETLVMNYQKRWSALRVKILHIEQVITEATNEITQCYLREHKEEQERILFTEKNELERIINQIKNPTQ